MTGMLRSENGDEIDLFATGQQPRLEVLLKQVQPGADGVARLKLTSDTLVRPSDLYSDATDTRQLGFGLVRVERVQSM